MMTPVVVGTLSVRGELSERSSVGEQSAPGSENQRMYQQSVGVDETPFGQ